MECKLDLLVLYVVELMIREDLRSRAEWNRCAFISHRIVMAIVK